MKRSSKIIMLVLVVVFIILYISHRSTPTTPEATTQQEASNPESLKKLESYRDRFARNAYHLQRALSSVQKLETALDTTGNEVFGDVAIQLNILHHRTNIHLENVMESLKKYEEYPNLSHRDLLEEAIAKLEKVDQEIINDSLNRQDVQSAFLYALNALAKAEITISESAYKTHQEELAKLALKQAQLHVKNAFLMDYATQPNGEYYTINAEVFEELERLIDSDSISADSLDSQLTQVSKELDSLLLIIQNRDKPEY